MFRTKITRVHPELVTIAMNGLVEECGICRSKKGIMTRECKHKCCVKCYKKSYICKECEKPGSCDCCCD